MFRTELSFEEIAATMCESCRYKMDGGCVHVEGIEQGTPRLTAECYHIYSPNHKAIIPFSHILWCSKWSDKECQD